MSERKEEPNADATLMPKPKSQLRSQVVLLASTLGASLAMIFSFGNLISGDPWQAAAFIGISVFWLLVVASYIHFRC
jgi:hypothetical protein